MEGGREADGNDDADPFPIILGTNQDESQFYEYNTPSPILSTREMLHCPVLT